FFYFSFKELFSAHALALLEAPAPRLHLPDQFGAWTFPADTVRVITQQPGLVADIAYRPSRSTQIRRKRELLSLHEDRLFLRLIETPAVAEREPFASLLPDRQAFVLDLASDYLLHRLATDPDPTAATR